MDPLATIGGIFAHVGWVSRRKVKGVLNISDINELYQFEYGLLIRLEL
jgi:hypothetical protein